jgi:hypothetical protein
VTRIDMTTREWHELVKPVLPHTLKDSDFPELSHIRIEVGDRALYAIATDRYTLGAERRLLDRADRGQPQPPVHIIAPDVQASLKLFTYAKDNDPALTVTVDTVLIPSEVMGEQGSYSSMAVTLASENGSKMVMHDRRMTHRDPLASWQRLICAAMSRTQGGTLSGIDLNPGHLARWKDAVRAGERLTLWTGSDRKSPILAAVGEHFAGIWMPYVWGDGDAGAPADPAGLPWLTELHWAGEDGHA